MLTRRCLVASVVFGVSALAQDKSIVVASTTSTRGSGLFGHILPLPTLQSSRIAPRRSLRLTVWRAPGA
jgi:hypothetical protein